MKKKITNAFFKMAGITSIVVAVMFTKAFCQGPMLSAGISTYKLAVAAGTPVNMRLPKDIRSGDVISGTVVEDAANKTATQSNSSSLQGMVIEIDGKKTKLSNHLISFVVPAGIATIPFIIKNAAGQIIDHGQVPVIPSGISLPVQPMSNITQAFFPQEITQPGEALPIGGKFDGDAANTNVSLNGQRCDIIAESPRESFAEVPGNTAAGVTNISIAEKNGPTTTTKINVAVLNLSADKLSLRRGEKTTVDVKITGLEGLSEGDHKIKLTLVNQSPQTIAFTKESSNTITKEINTSSVKNGIYQFNTRIIGVTAGTYGIMASLTLPSTNNPCVDTYLARMEEIKLSKEKAMADCNSAECKAKVESETEKLVKACMDEFIKCDKNK